MAELLPRILPLGAVVPEGHLQVLHLLLHPYRFIMLLLEPEELQVQETAVMGEILGLVLLQRLRRLVGWAPAVQLPQPPQLVQQQ